jgi:membrane protease YdiL (CAAX protease family)
MVFGLAYRVTDYNILAPTLCHALINTGRAILF